MLHSVNHYMYIHCSSGTWKYKCIAHYTAKIVTEEERKEGNLDPMNYTCYIQTKTK